MRRALASVVAVALVVAGCGRDDDPTVATPSSSTTSAPASSTTAPTTTSTVPPEVSTSFPPPALAWESCGATVECATVELPRDYADPDGARVSVGVIRRRATGERRGAVFFNFGGPGAATSAYLPGWRVPGEISTHFDLVGVDPRGVGRSTPLRCGLDPTELYRVDPTVEDAADRDALVEISRDYADACARDRGDLLAHVGTRDVARDMDRVRAALGDEQLSFVGYSYGTSIGQVYAELFPERVRAMVLDGVVDPALSGIDGSIQQAEGFELTLSRWAEACGGRSTCTFADPLAAVDDYLARAEAGIASSDGRTLGPGEAVLGIAAALYATSRWAALDRGIAAAINGDGAGMFDLYDGYVQLVDFSVLYAVNCLDSTWPRDPARVFAHGERARAAAPRFGEALVNDSLRCALWPVPPEPLGAPTGAGAPPILVISSTGDPATPYENGVRVADRLESAVLLSVDADEHTVAFQGYPCVDAVVVDYLVDLVVPADGSTC